jgi:hypothetical protein
MKKNNETIVLSRQAKTIVQDALMRTAYAFLPLRLTSFANFGRRREKNRRWDLTLKVPSTLFEPAPSTAPISSGDAARQLAIGSGGEAGAGTGGAGAGAGLGGGTAAGRGRTGHLSGEGVGGCETVKDRVQVPTGTKGLEKTMLVLRGRVD